MTTQAGAKSLFLCFRRGDEKTHILYTRSRGLTDRTAIDTRGQDSREKLSIIPGIAALDYGITELVVKYHDSQNNNKNRMVLLAVFGL